MQLDDTTVRRIYEFDLSPDAYDAVTETQRATNRITGVVTYLRRTRLGWRVLAATAVLAAGLTLAGCRTSQPLNCAGYHVDPLCYGGR